MAFFSLFTTAFSSVFYGVIVTAVIMAILYVILKTLSQGIVQSLPFYVTGVVLAILLVIQLSLMIGAFQAKESADSAEIYLSQLLEGSYGTVSAQDSQRVLDTITEEFPLIGTYFGVANFSGHDVSELSSSMHETMIGYLNSYIWHRVWWILGMIIVACFMVMLFDKRGPTAKPKAKVRMASRKNYDDF
ncbi:MAG: hypothetical protein E7107_02585 [Prevotella sp.]|nr:hypothetical protein [Prevotella sp.]